VLLYFHGGGWTFCGIESHDPVCRTLSAIARCAVVSVDYRLSPEHRFPAALDDCYAVLRWARRQAREMDFDTGRMSVGGDSAGGNLAAAVTLRARSRRVPLVHQLLVYPVLDYFEPGTKSYRTNAEGYVLTRAAMVRFWGNYLGSRRDVANPLVCPLRCPDLSGLPPALILTAEFDPLRDEAAKYGCRLREAGVPARVVCYRGAIHGFWNMSAVFPQGVESLTTAGLALRKLYWGGRFREAAGA
jgi:acetyl esterase